MVRRSRLNTVTLIKTKQFEFTHTSKIRLMDGTFHGAYTRRILMVSLEYISALTLNFNLTIRRRNVHASHLSSVNIIYFSEVLWKSYFDFEPSREIFKFIGRYTHYNNNIKDILKKQTT